MKQLSLFTITFILAFTRTSYGANCVTLLGGRSDVTVIAADKTVDRLHYLLANSDEARDFVAMYREYISKVLQARALDNSISTRSDFLVAIINKTTDEFIQKEIFEGKSTSDNIRALVAKQMEVLAYMKVGTRIPHSLEVHFKNMLELLVLPYGKKPLYVKDEPEVYFLKRFGEFLDSWLSILAIAGEVNFEDFMSNLDSKKPLRAFVVYELIKQWDIHLWTIDDFD